MRNNAVNVRVGRPEAGEEAQANPSIATPVSQLVEQAFGPGFVDSGEHFDRLPFVRKFHYSAQVRKGER